MKRQGHKHKESFSILLLSNTGRGNRQFHISQSVFYVMVSLLLAVLIVIIALSVRCFYISAAVAASQGSGNTEGTGAAA